MSLKHPRGFPQISLQINLTPILDALRFFIQVLGLLWSALWLLWSVPGLLWAAPGLLWGHAPRVLAAPAPAATATADATAPFNFPKI